MGGARGCAEVRAKRDATTVVVRTAMSTATAGASVGACIAGAGDILSKLMQ